MLEYVFTVFEGNFHFVGVNYVPCWKFSRVDGVEGASHGFFLLKTLKAIATLRVVGCSLAYNVMLSLDSGSEA